MRVCTKCNIEKPLDDYHRHPRSPDGRQSVCKICRSIQMREYNSTERSKLLHKASKKKYQETEHGAARIRESRQAWRKSDERRARAHNAVQRHLTNPMKCEKCANNQHIQAHHRDYGKPLDVVWLCPVCHRREHEEQRV